MTTATPLWTPTPDRIARANVTTFAGIAQKRARHDLHDYASLHAWSVMDPAGFWDLAWDYLGVIGDKGDVVLPHGQPMMDTRFFPNGKLNFAENLLRHRNGKEAIVFYGENRPARRLSWDDLYDAVARLRLVLIDAGVGEGDRVAGLVANMPEAIIGLLAASSIGAVWSSASPDFGVQGVIDRFGQIEPKVLIAVDAYAYNGKVVDCLQKLSEIIPLLPTLKQTLIVSYAGDADAPVPAGAARYESATAAATPQGDIPFPRFPFNHPLVILFSSGTTGIPKCIVHGAGGTLIQHMKEHQLQCDVRTGDKMFYFTTCSWMMWNWLVTGLASSATLVLYDGSPFFPSAARLFDIAQTERITLFGTAAKYIDALKKFDLRPKDTHDLSSIRTLTSTGSPLVHESFVYVYDAIKSDLHLASISGGTDIVSCFVIGNPISPVYAGEIQGAGLGYAMDVFDDNGHPLPAGAGQGELVCKKPFPSMPVFFWNDPDGARYRAAYFERYTLAASDRAATAAPRTSVREPARHVSAQDSIWCHGDWVERTANGGFIITGRSDATLKPGGVRIGTAEIYRQVEQVHDVLESLAVGQDWDNDVRVILFVRLKDGVTLDNALTDKIKQQIKTGASPRHVPAKIIAVTDLPRTKSGKLVELAVREVIAGRPVKNKEALANPEALSLFENLEQLKS